MGVLAATVIARGAPAVVVPLALYPQVTDPVLAAFDERVPALITPTVRATLFAVLLGCAVVAVVDAGLHRCTRDVAEPALLLVLFVVLPPFAAFGIYFRAWHALHHTARLIAADPRNASDLAARRWGGPLRRFVTSAAIPTGVVLIGIAALIALAGRPGLLVPALTVLLALTVPHVVIVAALDRRGNPPTTPVAELGAALGVRRA